MADFRRNIQDPSLSGLDQSAVRPVSNGNAGEAAAIGQVLQQAAGLYGQYKAKVEGQKLGGEGENYEQAGLAADQAGSQLESLFGKKSAETGADVTADQAQDLRNEVFGKILNNQKRIQAALSRGLISSTEATARLNVLRNQALSNPLVAPYQDQLDNALYKTTGGSGTTFAATAEETANAAAQKGRLQAIEETEKQVTSMLSTGIASDRKQALGLIAQTAQIERDLQNFSVKKAALGASSNEVYAQGQRLATMQSSSAYGRISDWARRGGDAKETQSILSSLTMEAEQVKQAIRASAFDENGKLVIDSDTLSKSLADVDQRVSDYTRMLQDQSGTKALVDMTAQRTAALAYQSQTIQIEVAKYAPVFYAMKDNPVASSWLWNNAVNQNELSTAWQKSTSPLLRYMGEIDNASRMQKTMDAADNFRKGAPVDETGGAVLGSTLPNKGGKAVVDEAYKANPEQTLKTLSNSPFTLKSIYENAEWRKGANTPEGIEQVNAVIEGAASRALISSIYEPATYDRTAAGVRGSSSARPSFEVPTEVVVKRNTKPAATGGGRGGGNTVGRKFEEWTIDTKGVRVSDQYKSEVVNAYKLGTENPQLWNAEFESVDAWVNSLFARSK